MDRFEYRLIDVASTLLQAFPQGSSGDNVTITIYDVDDAATDVNAVAMTNVSTNSWKYAWTPTEAHNYVVTFKNNTLEVEEYLYVNVSGSVTGVSGGSGTGTTLTNLRERFLKLLDNYNANDLTGTNSSGEVADLCINEALQNIYAQLKASRYLEAYGSTALVSVASQSYIELSNIADLDEIRALKDTTNQITLFEISAARYFREVPDPSAVTGTSYRFCRIFNRIYLDPRPTTAITYTCEYIKNYARLSSDSDRALIPSAYDKWIYDEARVLWLQMEDITAIGVIEDAKAERKESRDLFIGTIMAQFGRSTQAGSTFLKRAPISNPYNHIT